MLEIKTPTDPTLQIVTLKARADFQRVRGGGRATSASFILEGKSRSDALENASDRPDVSIYGPRFGFTITRKIGNAVTRNRIRRRLRAALTAVAKRHARNNVDYVVVARLAAADQDFQLLMRDLISAFRRVHSALKITQIPSRSDNLFTEVAPRLSKTKDRIPKV